MRKFVVLAAALAIAAVVAVAALAGNGTPINTGSDNVLTLAVYGDAPYGVDQTDTSEFEATPAFVDSINNGPTVDLVAHVGDIHSGKQYCTEAYDRSIYDLWTKYKDPVVYTPGDNEWTDCHKATSVPYTLSPYTEGEGGGLYNATTGQIDYVLDADGNSVDYAKGNPVDNLALIRSIFFPTPGVTLGGRKKQVISQAQAFDSAHPTDANYVENVMWEQSKTMFVTVNIPGGSNNDADPWYKVPKSQVTQAQKDEISQRTGADVRWIQAAFERAQADGVTGVVIFEQADMFDIDGKDASHLTGYKPFTDAIAAGATTFAKPVLLFNGDSHVYRSDNPFVQGAPCVSELPACVDGDAWDKQAGGYDVPNIHRVTVHGSTFPLEWLRLTVDPRASNPTTDTSFGPFSWERIQP